MSYSYQALKPSLFTDDGQRTFLKIRDHVSNVLKASGAITCGAAIRVATGDTWLMLACVDRMVELGELRRITTAAGTVSAQDEIFVKGSGES
jgi:hypothetical protein